MTFETLLTHRGVQALGRAPAAVLALFIAAAPVVAQQPAFEVASIKPDVSGQPGPRFKMFPGLTVERATLKDLLTMAYGVKDFQVSGGPGWINSDRYNIDAKVEGTPTLGQEGLTLQRQRLQTLLQDRFRLALHRETKQLPIYELAVAKGGPKMQPPACIQGDPIHPAIAPGKTLMDYCGSGAWGRGQLEASSASMADMAGSLTGMLGRVVVDKTGIAGTFRIHLTFTPDDSMPQFPDPPPELGAAPADGPNIFTAVQEQLGLKLESAKGPVDVLVIDRVEKPSEN